MFKVIIAGSRSFNNYELLNHKVNYLLQNRVNFTEIVSGTARGADQLGERWAEKHGVPVAKFPAKWDEHGKRAGYLRNKEMAEYADALIAFWDGKSKGTRHMIRLAKEYDLEVRVVRF